MFILVGEQRLPPFSALSQECHETRQIDNQVIIVIIINVDRSAWTDKSWFFTWNQPQVDPWRRSSVLTDALSLSTCLSTSLYHPRLRHRSVTDHSEYIRMFMFAESQLDSDVLYFEHIHKICCHLISQWTKCRRYRVNWVRSKPDLIGIRAAALYLWNKRTQTCWIWSDTQWTIFWLNGNRTHFQLWVFVFTFYGFV